MSTFLSPSKESYSQLYEVDKSRMENSTIFKHMSTYVKKSELKLMPYVLFEKYLGKPQRRMKLSQSLYKNTKLPPLKNQSEKPSRLSVNEPSRLSVLSGDENMLQDPNNEVSTFQNLRMCVTPRLSSNLSKFNTTVSNYGRELDTNLNGVNYYHYKQLIVNKKDKRFYYTRRRRKIKSRNYNRIRIRVKKSQQQVLLGKKELHYDRNQEKNQAIGEEFWNPDKDMEQAATTIQGHFRQKQKRKQSKNDKKEKKLKQVNEVKVVEKVQKKEKTEIQIGFEFLNPDKEMEVAASKIQSHFRDKQVKTKNKQEKLQSNNIRLAQKVTDEVMFEVLNNPRSYSQDEGLAQSVAVNICDEILDMGL